jgi:hypothetical protein
MILVVAPEDDLHACVVRERLIARGAECMVWDSARFPWRDRLSWAPGDGAAGRLGDTDVTLSDVTRIWWRRSRPATVDPLVEDAHVRRFCIGEARELVRGVAQAGAPVTNDPSAEQRAESKILQLAIAARIGLPVPPTVVSNDADRLRAFVQSHPRSVIKTLRCDYVTSIPTRVVGSGDLCDPRAVALAPVIVQGLVECEADVRVCMVGNQTFAAALRRPDRNENVDWRLTATGWEPLTLPEAVSRQLRHMLDELGLETGSFDLRLTGGGTYVFLEINPSGQFLFLEIDAGLPISEAMAAHLDAFPARDGSDG